VTEPVTATRGQRQGSISSGELLGLGRARHRGPWRGLVFLALLMVVLVVGGGLFLGPRLQDSAYDMARSNPQVMRLPMVPDVVRERLGTSLTTAAGTRGTPVKFTVGGGETVGQVGRALAAQGLLLDALAFSYLAVTQGVDDKLHTGTFNLDASMTPQQIVDRLQLPPDPVTTRVLLNLRAGLRLEQIAAKLQTEKAMELDPREFYDLLIDPPDWVRTEFPWLKALPEGRSLEGFVGLGPIPVDANISPDDLLRVLLTVWETNIGPDVIDEVEKSGKDFYEVLTLASIAQRETADPDELDRVAGVYVNRLDPSLWPTQILNADPTVSYAVDTDKLSDMEFDEWQKYSFFAAVRNQARRKVSAAMQSYQTYVNPGLPDGPIGSPNLASIRAAANPDTKGGYLFFYACPESKTHRFAKDQAAHQRNIDRCK
jgi:UPF0755 protein